MALNGLGLALGPTWSGASMSLNPRTVSGAFSMERPLGAAWSGHPQGPGERGWPSWPTTTGSRLPVPERQEGYSASQRYTTVSSSYRTRHPTRTRDLRTLRTPQATTDLPLR